MRIYRRLDIKNRIFSFTITLFYAHKQYCSGITSHVIDDNGNFVYNKSGELQHYILWDLEGCNLKECIRELKRIQKKFNLDTIRIIADDNPNSFRALCFTKVDFHKYMIILHSTKYVDNNFIDYVQKRKYAVIRLSKKINRKIQKEVSVLYRNNADIPKQFQSVIYETSYDNKTNAKTITIGG